MAHLTGPSTRTPTVVRSLRSHLSAVAGYVYVRPRKDMTAELIYDEEAPAKAKELLSQMAAAGDAEAMFYLGHLADEENPRDAVAAFEWYDRAAKRGHLEAAHWKASHLYYGIGTEQDLPAALQLFEACAKQGHDASQWKLGQHFLSVPGETARAKSWLARAAAQGHSDAQRLLSEAGGSDV